MKEKDGDRERERDKQTNDMFSPRRGFRMNLIFFSLSPLSFSHLSPNPIIILTFIEGEGKP